MNALSSTEIYRQIKSEKSEHYKSYLNGEILTFHYAHWFILDKLWGFFAKIFSKKGNSLTDLENVLRENTGKNLSHHMLLILVGLFLLS